jgi:hypothetical protein
MLSFGAILFIIQLQKLMNNNMNENFDSTDAKEALQNIASVYNNGVLTVSKLNVTGDLAVTGKSSFGDDITSAKKITTTDASIGNQLFFTNKDDTAQKETWYIHNWADRLNMRSNKSNTGGVLLTNNYYGNGTVATFYDNKGTTKMLVGTSSVNAGDTTRGVVNIYNANGSGRWGMGDSS